MFDAERIALMTNALVQRHLTYILAQLYFVMPLNDEEFIRPVTDSPLQRRIQLLVAVANGQHEPDQGYQEGVREAWQSIEQLITSIESLPGQSELMQIMQIVKLWLDEDELLTHHEAANLLKGSSSSAALRFINQLIASGKLKQYLNYAEHDPKNARRVSRNEVTALKARTD